MQHLHHNQWYYFAIEKSLLNQRNRIRYHKTSVQFLLTFVYFHLYDELRVY